MSLCTCNKLLFTHFLCCFLSSITTWIGKIFSIWLCNWGARPGVYTMSFSCHCQPRSTGSLSTLPLQHLLLWLTLLMVLKISSLGWTGNHVPDMISVAFLSFNAFNNILSNRSPFEGHEPYLLIKRTLLTICLELATNAQRDLFAEQPVQVLACIHYYTIWALIMLPFYR